MDFESFEFRDSEWVWKKKKESGYDPHLLSLEWWEVCEWIGLFVDRRQMSSSDETAFDFSLCFPLSLFLTLSLNFLLFLSVCLSRSPFRLSVSLSLFLSLSSNLRLDLLNPHTVHLTYTFIRIKTRW